MSKMPKFVVIIVAVAAACWGQNQIATVSSPSAFTLRGAPVNPGLGVPSWPVLAGDTIKSGNSPVTITFSDGSTITLNSGAEATLDLSGQIPVFRLTKGSASYNLKTLTSVQVMSGNQSFTISTQTGTLSKAGAHTALAMVGAGAAAGLGVGVSQATKGGSSVSPSH
jgi:hypothetical protein